jgi:hypothetical protein
MTSPKGQLTDITVGWRDIKKKKKNGRAILLKWVQRPIGLRDVKALT